MRWASLIGAFLTIAATSGQGNDPSCGSPSSLDRVRAIRAQMKVAGALRALPQAPSVTPQLAIERRAGSPFPHFTAVGPPGQVSQLEATADLASGQWAPWLSVSFGTQPLRWMDEGALNTPFRFFRLRSADSEAFNETASTFRLIDAAGVACDLYYHSDLQAIAVVAAGSNLLQIAPSLPVLNDAALTYSNRIQVWVLLENPAPVRSNVLAQAQELKINFPVLLDRNGLAARSVGLTRVGEVALVQPPAFTVAYRGELGQSAPANSTLFGQALAAVNAGQNLSFLRAASAGPLLAHAGEETPEYGRDVAPVLYQYCAPCHRPNGVAPFAMTTHNVVEQWALSIKHALLSGKMPPWHADPDYGHFANDLSLPGDLKSTLIRWLDAGAPRGTGPDPLAERPTPPAYGEWPADLGEPDALVTIPVQSIKADGSEPYRYLYVQMTNTTNVWLRSAIVRPSNYKAVHHYLVWPGRIGNSGGPDNSTYQPHIAEYVPGYQPFRIPADAGYLLGRSNWLTFNLHYTTSGMETNDQPVLALWYHKSRPARTWGVIGVGRTDFKIPPGASDHEVQSTWTTQNRITLHRFNPHMHVRGKRMKYEVVYPDRKREVLLSVPDYDFNWQIGYDLAEPKTIPAGSRIVVTGAFDNSPQNLANPDPTATVQWGDQSWMEMFIGYIDFTQ